ncbi:hypothetical protein A2291_01555 [candidate division WOR-1 bacterium RIFOXYB2_FULL_42_35]|uniref:DUF2442 domain-containing protein n=1 Tax=candidate division WOR-1 bacterium RIFOXYC2_FULL_41_25 TaxID=1802586 RepID=A0A1F4TQ84_UNCSA|nr:MAG: hypothetical protein A2247_03355 [candidate division WOR-1 bacterium RIFOXYA2_FULL_41_14]OGC25432.1 MAG: hypothetical protein A2291_01555 [candidate division WOR-1 bacterium RIFOXYB2_FULL_42_35]OGC34838.1 MAG: hypothetical protein A2462_05490 [candidate division WOR-1 bacterium RIFOXYC2_FULL_41_25]OGC42671.1 MAG: hypothetical protein A2548_07725 [candidate division WOR-1 bacterium RIFOXYD2_FULL_41_8]
MNTLISAEAKAQEVKITNEDLIVTLIDSREIKIPLVWFPKLFHATKAQRKKFRFIGNGIGIHWPSIDEDLSVPALLRI